MEWQAGRVLCQEPGKCTGRRARCDFHFDGLRKGREREFLSEIWTDQRDLWAPTIKCSLHPRKKEGDSFHVDVTGGHQDEGKHLGVGVLKRYLQYARDGVVMNANPTGEDCDSDFERWVLQVLHAHGYEAVPQVGVCGYRIDIAVRHPAKPGMFLCGIECDGATYHSARSVRERDRLRQEILERYKWKLYRIWSTDWFRNPSRQTKQLLRYLEQLHPPLPRE